MATKKKTTRKVSSRSSNKRMGMDNNTFLLIVGGGFVVFILVFLLLGNANNDTTMVNLSPSPETKQSNQKMMAISVESPSKDEVITSPVTIKGKANVFENKLAYRIKDSDGFVLVSGNTTYTSEDTGKPGDYSVTTNFLEPKGLSGTVEVYDLSAKDGSEENLVSVPVKFK